MIAEGKPSPELQTKIDAAGAGDMQALNDMLGAIRAVPGVAGAEAIYAAPMRPSGSDVDYAVHGVSTFTPGMPLPNADIQAMTPGYLAMMGIPVLRGRGFTAADGPGAEKIVLISAAMAEQSFHGMDPIGKQIMCGWEAVPEWWTIVGVVGDVRQDSPATQPRPTIYTPVAQHAHNAPDMQVVVRTRSNDEAMAATLAQKMKQQYPQVALRYETMTQDEGKTERDQRFRTLLFGSFAGVSILLAITGMYGVTAYTVAQKRFEFALRFALGAQRSTVLGGVLRSALLVATVGVAAGVGLSLALTRVLATLLGQVAGIDALAFAIAGAGVLMVALLAALQPACRAATVEPMQVLRSE
jgi:putative ABC transport system permease protein